MGEAVSAIAIIVLALSIITLIVFYITRKYGDQRTFDFSSQIFQRYLIIAENLVETTVIKLNQTVVTGLKEASVDGKISKEEAIKILNDAVTEIKAILGPQFITLISSYIGDFDAWLHQQIEKYVSKCKEEKKTFLNLYNSFKENNLLK